jgi:hypothetical protein
VSYVLLTEYNPGDQMNNEMVGHVAHVGGSGRAYRALVGKCERKRLCGSPGQRWEDNMKMDLQ